MTIHDDDVQEARAHPERVGLVSKQFETGAPVTFHVLAPYWLGEGEEWLNRPAKMYEPLDIGRLTDGWLKAAQERLHRQIGQWGRFAHRKVAERAAIERYAYLAKNDPQRAGLEYRIRVTNRTPE